MSETGYLYLVRKLILTLLLMPLYLGRLCTLQNYCFHAHRVESFFKRKILCVFITVLYTQAISVCVSVFVGSSATSILNCLQILAQSLDIR